MVETTKRLRPRGALSGVNETWPAHLGLIYLVLLPLIVGDGLVWADGLAPLLFLTLVIRHDRHTPFLRPPLLWLVVSLGLATIVTAVRGGGSGDLRELIILCYMTALFLYFRAFSPPVSHLFVYGLVTLLVMLAYAIIGGLLGIDHVYGPHVGSTLDFAARRFVFTFPNSNLTSSFYALPILGFLLGCQERLRLRTPLSVATFCACLLVLCLPLGLTVSRNMLIPIAVILGFLGEREVSGPWTSWPTIRWGILALLFVGFALTVIFPFFPLQATPPFFNTRTGGMYTIHHVIYTKMVLMSPVTFLMGLGRDAVSATYPALADPDAISAVLAQYGISASQESARVEAYAVFRDAHNEYLNLAVHFGVPAMVAMYAFWVSGGRAAQRRRLAIPYVVGVLMASCWDDLLSKRWIWVCLGLLSATASRVPERAAPRPQDVQDVAEP